MLITCKISYTLMNLNKNICIKMIYLLKFSLNIILSENNPICDLHYCKGSGRQKCVYFLGELF